MKKKIIIILIFACLFLFPINKVDAKTLNDMYNELNQLKEQKAKNDSSKKLTQKQINEIANNITKTTEEIEKSRSDIVEANQKIDKSKEEIELKKEETKEMLKFLQKSNGENVYLEYIMESDSYTELIQRYAVVNQISTYNEKVMSDLEVLINNLEQSKIELANKQKELEAKRVKLNNQRSSLGGQLSSYEQTATTIEEDIRDLQNEINYYKNDLGCSMDQDIEICTQIAYSNSFRYPLVSSYLTSLYGYRWGSIHRGQDYGASVGTKVYSVANGTVARVVYRASCGGNIVYIYHNVKGKAYTSVYMHLESYTVKVGDKVTSDSVIGYSGGGGWTLKKNGGWDTCSTGAHLHFGIAEGHNAYAFNAYAFDPKEIFPKLTVEYSSRWSSR